MFLTGPPGEPGGGGLCVVRTQRRIFDGSSDLAADPSMRLYLSDMVAPYGLALRDEVLAAGAGHSYGEMAEPLVDAVVDADTPVDLLVLAYAIHDVRFGRNTATYLSGRCAGNPLAFAVCDQGAAAPFSALRAMHAYAATGACQRALLVVVEQSALHYELAEPARVPGRHAAVALLLERRPGVPSVAVRQRTAVDPGEVDALLTAELAGLPPGRGAALVLGADLAERWTGHPAVDELVPAPAGQPYTGVWWELSRRLPGWWLRGRHVVVAEYEPALGYLCTAALHFVEEAAGSPESRSLAHSATEV
jgi:4-hydroxymandelate oxidase